MFRSVAITELLGLNSMLTAKTETARIQLLRKHDWIKEHQFVLRNVEPPDFAKFPPHSPEQ